MEPVWELVSEGCAMKTTALPMAATNGRFQTCSAGHRRIEIEIEIEIGIDWFHATRKAHPIDPDFDFQSCAPCEELTGR